MKRLAILTAALAALALAGSASAGVAEDLAAKNKCSKCHTEKTTKKGPSWASVAVKYKGKAEARDKLFTQLKNGGRVGDEEDHKKVVASDDDIKALVELVLASK